MRNAASTNQSVVSYATIIDVANDDLKLKPGMTANVSIIVAQKQNVLRVANSALRVRLPQELLPPKPAAAGAAVAKGGKEKSGAAPMTDAERFAATGDIMRDIGFQRGTQATPEQIEKARTLAKEKGLDADLVVARLSMPAGRGKGEKGKGGGGGGGGGRSASASGSGFTNTIVDRQVFKLADPNAKPKRIEPVMAKLGISDGSSTEVIDGLAEGDVLVTAVIMPGTPAPMLAPGGSSTQNPFQGSRGFGGSPGMRSR